MWGIREFLWMVNWGGEFERWVVYVVEKEDGLSYWLLLGGL